MRKRAILIGGLVAIIIIGSFAGYSAYQTSKPEYNTISLSYNQWKHTANENDARFYQMDAKQETIILEDITTIRGVKAILIFPDIIVGEMSFQMKSDATLNREMIMRFTSDNKQLWYIFRAKDGTYWFGIGQIGLNLYDGDANFHDYYIEWDFSGDTQEITVKFDDKIILENYSVNFRENSLNTIIWETFDYHFDSKTTINVDESYLRVL